MSNNKIILTPKEANFYVFCAIYFAKFDLFDCVEKQSKIIKHVGGTYSGTQKSSWQKTRAFL
jgi:hypothetical protein